MKQAIVLMLLILLAAGCKKGSDNPGLECGVNSHFENGACICNDGWFGWNCDRNVLTDCGPHGTGYENWCICDTGWIGENCQMDVARYSGRYRFVGIQTFWHMGNPPEYGTDTIDEISELVFYSDTIYVRGKLFVYTNNTGGQTTNNYYVFNVIQSYINGANYGSVRLKKSSPDTINYYTSEGGMGGGTDCSLRGIKIQ